MAYGTANVDTIQSSTANTPVQFNDGNGTQVGTLCRAWVNTQSNGTINASFNVSSVTVVATGIYKITFTNALPDSNYAYSGCIPSSASGDRNILISPANSTDNAAVVAQTTSAFYYKIISTATIAFSEPHMISVFR